MTRRTPDTPQHALALPRLVSERLVLRGFTMADAGDVQRMAGDPRIAATTTHIPHPYPDGAAEAWIATHGTEWAMGRRAVFAITSRESDRLVGAVGLTINKSQGRGELGYWIAVECWGRGYATEAATRVMELGFQELGLRRIQARHFDVNLASGRVMEKLGMRREATLRRHVRKGEEVHDVVMCAAVRRGAS